MHAWLLMIVIGLPLTDAQDLTVSDGVTYQTELACYSAAKPVVLKIEHAIEHRPLGKMKVIKFYCKRKLYA